MIKMVVTDMDHTLLDDDSNLPKDFDLFVNEMKEKGIHLVMASGRTIVSIKKKVAKHLNDVSIISDNGSIVEYHGEIAYVEQILPDMIKKIIDQAVKCDNSSIIAASVTSAYVQLGEESHKPMLYEYYPEITYVDDLTQVEDKIVKITLMSPDQTVHNFNTYIKDEFSETMNAVMSGTIWIDIMNQDIDKGNGLKFLMDKLNVEAKDVIAFGDYHNDIGMLKRAGRGFAVSNAHDDVKAIADEVVGSNNESAVITTVRRLLNQ